MAEARRKTGIGRSQRARVVASLLATPSLPWPCPALPCPATSFRAIQCSLRRQRASDVHTRQTPPVGPSQQQHCPALTDWLTAALCPSPATALLHPSSHPSIHPSSIAVTTRPRHLDCQGGSRPKIGRQTSARSPSLSLSSSPPRSNCNCSAARSTTPARLPCLPSPIVPAHRR